MFAVIFICGNLFLRIAGKIAKIRTRKNFVPHAIHLSGGYYNEPLIKGYNFSVFGQIRLKISYTLKGSALKL